MWTIRFLNGELAGQEMHLQEGEYTLGRAEECQITIPDPGISKKHLQMEVSKDGIFIEDLNSSNGTFVNGVKVRESKIKPQDKVSLYQCTFDIIRHLGNLQPASAEQSLANASHQPAFPAYSSQPHIPPYGHSPSTGTGGPPAEPALKLTLKNWFNNYMNSVVLPGVYKLPSWLELKLVIAGFLVFFVVVMTALSSVPLIRILNSSVEQESMNHAETIATVLAQENRESVKNKIHSSASVEYALRRPGVTKAFIINAVDGRILAPSEQAHTYSKLPFINEARKKEAISVKKLDSDTVAAMVPIQFFNTKTNTHRAAAYAAVIYNIGALAYGNKRVLSLLVQTCFIASVLGVLLFFFLYKMIEYPIVNVNRQLDSALKDDTLDVKTDYQFTPLQTLVSNINSALSRISAVQDNSQSLIEYDRQNEMNHLIEMIGYPTLGINLDTNKIDGISAHFEEETGISSERILNCAIEDIDDQALKLNITGLLEKINQHSDEIAIDNLEFSGVEFQLSAKGIYGKDHLSYALISFIPINQAQQEEA